MRLSEDEFLAPIVTVDQFQSTTSNRTIEHTLTASQANFKMLFFAIPMLLVGVAPFVIIHGKKGLINGPLEAFGGIGNFFIIYFLGIAVHELLHGMTMAIFAENGIRAVKFGIQWKSLTPYAHCKDKLKVYQYKLVTVIPLIVLGVVPTIISFINGIGWLNIFGLLFTLSAVGDILIFNELRKVNHNEYVKDHPSKIGFIRIIQ